MSIDKVKEFYIKYPDFNKFYNELEKFIKDRRHKEE